MKENLQLQMISRKTGCGFRYTEVGKLKSGVNAIGGIRVN